MYKYLKKEKQLKTLMVMKMIKLFSVSNEKLLQPLEIKPREHFVLGDKKLGHRPRALK